MDLFNYWFFFYGKDGNCLPKSVSFCAHSSNAVAYLAAQLEATFTSLHCTGVGSHGTSSCQWKISSDEVWHFWAWTSKLQAYAPLCSFPFPGSGM